MRRPIRLDLPLMARGDRPRQVFPVSPTNCSHYQPSRRSQPDRAIPPSPGQPRPGLRRRFCRGWNPRFRRWQPIRSTYLPRSGWPSQSTRSSARQEPGSTRRWLVDSRPRLSSCPTSTPGPITMGTLASSSDLPARSSMSIASRSTSEVVPEPRPRGRSRPRP